MKQVKMCSCEGCNKAYVEAFENLLKGKEVEFTTGCIGQCSVTTPTCTVDDKVIEADTVEALAALIQA
jgi:NADH:ubiquinone oxidoreductase subunit E